MIFSYGVTCTQYKWCSANIEKRVCPCALVGKPFFILKHVALVPIQNASVSFKMGMFCGIYFKLVCIISNLVSCIVLVKKTVT